MPAGGPSTRFDCGSGLKRLQNRSDKLHVELPCWTFARGGDKLVLTREETPHGVNLIVASEGVPRVYSFPDLVPLVRFQSDMESFLLRTGWQFIEFTPDRRSGADRRDFPRIANDRRRWWTDGVKLFLPRDRRPVPSTSRLDTIDPPADEPGGLTQEK